LIGEFSDSILKVDSRTNKELQDCENYLYQLQYLFGALKYSQKEFHDPRHFCASWKDFDGNQMNVLQQMDVDEFFNTLMDRLEQMLKPQGNHFILNRIFGGVFSNELICKGISYYSEREEPFMALPLQVKNKKNIYESLQAYIEGEMLEGENAYYVEKYDKKVPTLKRQSIKKLPNILNIVLKRFEFDYETMQKYKVNDFCEFPLELDMREYTQNALKLKDQLAKKKDTENRNDEEEIETEEEKPKENKETENSQKDKNKIVMMPDDYYKYKLRGVIIHEGTAESGHYYSLVNPKGNNQWFEVNDILIKDFDVSLLP
jgi:ubiquitin carboxyl-terminal hydrolase 9/24